MVILPNVRQYPVSRSERDAQGVVESDVVIIVLYHYDKDCQAGCLSLSKEKNPTCSDENGPGSRDSGEHCSNSVRGILVECKHFRKAREAYNPLLGVRVASQTNKKKKIRRARERITEYTN